MKIGIIGSATVGRTLAEKFARAGHDVILSNRSGPDSLLEIVANLGLGVRAASRFEAITAPVVVLALPWTNVASALTPDVRWDGRILVDATNIFKSYAPDYQRDDLGGDSGSETIARLAPQARVVKAFNTLPIAKMFAEAPAGMKRVLFLAGDDDDSKLTVGGLISDIGLIAKDVGSLAHGGRLMELGGSLSGLELLTPINH